MKNLYLFFLAVLPLVAAAQTIPNGNKPFGFATCSSRTDASQIFEMTGGGSFDCRADSVEGSIVLKSDGNDMAQKLTDAVGNHSVVVLDGSAGEFLISKVCRLQGLKDKTIVGINNATLRTVWHITPEIVDRLNSEGIPAMTTNGGGGTLPNGKVIKEQAEYNTRRILIEMLNDKKEKYRNSGIFALEDCQNVILRNLKLIGPGSIDVGGKDLLSLAHCTNMWIDHCDFIDGMDGNLDITDESDFCTVSWCTFSYTEHSYRHQNTNLVGSGDSEPQGKLNITYAYNVWGAGCRARMPMVRVGKVHVLNNYYCCEGNASSCINPRKYSECLVEGNYFAKNIKKVFEPKDAAAYVWDDSNITVTQPKRMPQSKGKVKIPYKYTVLPAETLPPLLSVHAGARL